MTRTSINQGILRQTGFVNAENINPAGTWSLGLLQMDFFYRTKPWYAGQFIRRITPKIDIPKGAVPFLTTVLNLQKPQLLSVLVRNVDATFRSIAVALPVSAKGEIDFAFMEAVTAALEAERVARLKAYLTISGLEHCELSDEEEAALMAFAGGRIAFSEYRFDALFNHIEQGRRLKKEDQRPGDIPFVMSGVTNTGVVDHISNPVAAFPANSITIDIFGNSFYRSYGFGAGDDTGVYWNDAVQYSREAMLFIAASMGKSLRGKYSYGKKLRSSQSHAFKMKLPTKDGRIDLQTMESLISALQKLVIRDVVRYADRKTAPAGRTAPNDNR